MIHKKHSLEKYEYVNAMNLHITRIREIFKN